MFTRKSLPTYLVITFVFFALLLGACQSNFGPDASATPPPPSPTTARPLDTALPTETPGSQSATATPPLTATRTISAGTTARQLRIFTELWESVRDTYVYEDFNGVDWNKMGRRYQSLIETGLSDDEFYQAMDRLIGELDDDHSLFLSPQQVIEEEEMLTGDLDYVGIGVYTTDRPEKGYAVLLLVFPGSPAEQSGLLSHDRILTVEGLPAVVPDGIGNLDALKGPEGAQVHLTAETPGQEPREVLVTRRRIQTQLPVISHRLPDTNVGYVLIPSFLDRTISRRVGQALSDLMAEGELDGLIIDMRINGGGLESELKGTLAYFVDGTMGYYLSRERERPLLVYANPIGNSQTAPIALLVGRETASYGEIFCGVLQENRDVLSVGRTSLGNIETLWSIDLEDGSRAWVARETFRPPSGADWEETGIIPDVEIELDWAEFNEQDDPQLATALALLLGQAD